VIEGVGLLNPRMSPLHVGVRLGRGAETDLSFEA